MSFRYLLLAICALMFSYGQSFAADAIDPDKYSGQIKLACVGDSITAGVGAGKKKSWPDQIATLLGDKWKVGNFGNSGSTLLNKGDKPYQKQKSFSNALEFKPDVVVIILGTNDTKGKNWVHKDEFTTDYIDLINKFAALETKPRIFICYPPYIAGKGRFGINEENTKAEFPMIDAAAKATGATIIDVHASLVGKDDLIPDTVHPNAEGAACIARAVYTGLTGKNAP